MKNARILLLASIFITIFADTAWGAGAPSHALQEFPPSLDSYNESELTSIPSILLHRIKQEPFNLIATLIFLCAIIHTFMANKFTAISHARHLANEQKIKRGEADENSVDATAVAFHFLGEVEVIFGLWAIPLIMCIAFSMIGRQ
jgi:hypothetical protein